MAAVSPRRSAVSATDCRGFGDHDAAPETNRAVVPAKRAPRHTRGGAGGPRRMVRQIPPRSRVARSGGRAPFRRRPAVGPFDWRNTALFGGLIPTALDRDLFRRREIHHRAGAVRAPKLRWGGGCSAPQAGRPGHEMGPPVVNLFRPPVTVGERACASRRLPDMPYRAVRRCWRVDRPLCWIGGHETGHDQGPLV